MTDVDNAASGEPVLFTDASGLHLQKRVRTPRIGIQVRRGRGEG